MMHITDRRILDVIDITTAEAGFLVLSLGQNRGRFFKYLIFKLIQYHGRISKVKLLLVGFLKSKTNTERIRYWY